MCARDSAKGGAWTDCDLPQDQWDQIALNWITKEYGAFSRTLFLDSILHVSKWHYLFSACTFNS